MKIYTTAGEAAKVFCDLKTNGQITDEDTVTLLYDLNIIQERMASLKNTFPADTLHTAAIKANPLVSVLKMVNGWGVGLEAASRGELALAEAAGANRGQIVFDSPAKTQEEILYALKRSIYLNTDSYNEIERVEEFSAYNQITSGVGVRVNPQVGAGTISSTSVAAQVSKFGVPLDESDRLKEYYLKNSFLTGIHLHIGSQGCPLGLLVKGVKKVAAFAEEVNAESESLYGEQRIKTFDLGGGLPVGYYHEKSPVTINDYAELLKKEVPVLFSGKYRLITEFGRYIYANAGTVLSRIEYVKKFKDANIIMNHAGADLFLRKSYNPGDWHHEISLMNKNGSVKAGDFKEPYLIAGPLCFAGDIIERNAILPEAEAGDYLIIHDTGAYNLSAWSRYNSRQIPVVFGYNPLTGSIEVLKRRETLQEIVNFWS
ncbi:MAG: diaminopimelate decarboxylase [Ignavibacteriaceae bacterium]|nr:diaminopimelate decarboxylase [Ignavibacteriaceae bacterium]